MQISRLLRNRRAYTKTKSCILKYKKPTLLLGLFCFGFLLYYAGTFLHLSREFLLRINYNPAVRNPRKEVTTQPIPKIIHHIFFNISDKSEEFMQKYRPFQQTWIDKNPDHEYILWNDAMVDNLIDEHYPHFKPIYRKSHYKWNNRGDMARYLVMYHMGGVYADMDIECKQSLNNLYKESENKELLLNFTYNPVGMATDFFAASKNHNFFAHVIDGLDAADVPYLLPYFSAMFRAGPVYMLGRYLNYPYPDEIYWIPPETMLRLFDRTSFGQTWHEFDGKVIHLFWTKIGPKKILLFIVIVACVYRWAKRYNRPKANMLGLLDGNENYTSPLVKKL